MITLKEALTAPTDRAWTEDEIVPLTDQLRAICQRIQEEIGAPAVAIIVAGRGDATGRAHVFDASTVDFMPLSTFYGTVAGSHMEHEQRVKAEENAFDAAARRNGIN